MIRNLVIYSTPPDPEAFRRHYLECHIPLCKAIPNTLRISYTFSPDVLLGDADCFCVYEADYADQAALEEAKSSPEGQAAAADVRNYSPTPPIVILYELDEWHPPAASVS